MRRYLIIASLALAVVGYAIGAHAQQQVKGQAQYRSTSNVSQVITTSGTFQILLPAVTNLSNGGRQSLTVENNNTTSTVNCWINFGPTSSSAVISNSIYLPSGASYARYWPYVPSDQIQGTCVGGATSQTIYVDIQ